MCCTAALSMKVHDKTDPLFCSQCYEENRKLDRGITQTVLGKRKRILSASYSADPVDLESLKRVTLPKSHDRQHGTTRRRNGGFCVLYQRARKDWDYLLCNGVLPIRVNTKTRKDDITLKDMLLYLLQPQNIQMLSWGAKRIRVDNEWVRFSALMRRKTSEKIYRDYVEYTNARGPNDAGNAVTPLGRTAFLEVVELLTRGQISRKAAVDYVLGTMVYDNIRVLREIVSAEVQCQEYTRLLLSQPEAVEEFLKFVMLEHIAPANDPFHNSNFALDESVSSGALRYSTACKTCLSPFQVVANIREKISSERGDIVGVLNDANEKMLLYMGHQHRCYNQEKRIAELFADLKTRLFKEDLCSFA